MKNNFLLLTFSLVCLSFFGNLVVKSESSHHGQDPHGHSTLEIPANEPIPTVDLIIHEDELKGWNLEMRVSNFQFAPEKVNQANNFPEGHAHLYINGEKVTRIYGNWYYLEALELGSNEITIGLNSNSHEALVYDSERIADTEVIEVADSK